jgi:hypothetical protein
MTEPRPAEPVNPDCLLQAFFIILKGSRPDESDAAVRLTEADAGRLLERIAGEVGASPQMAMDLFRRCCAVMNFFAVASNRELVGANETKPAPAICSAAARVTVHHVIIDDMACDTFDPREFAAALKQRESRQH